MRYLALLLALACVPVAAAEPDFRVFAGYQLTEPTAHERIGRSAMVEWDRESGWYAGAEWRFNAAWGGLELDYTRVDHNLLLNGSVLGWAEESQISASLNLHLFDEHRWGLWFGPTLAYVDWGDLYQPHRRAIHLDNEWSVGINGGAAWHLTPWLSVVAGLRYVQTEIRQGTGGVDVDPFFLRTGLAVRF